MKLLWNVFCNLTTEITLNLLVFLSHRRERVSWILLVSNNNSRPWVSCYKEMSQKALKLGLCWGWACEVSFTVGLCNTRKGCLSPWEVRSNVVGVDKELGRWEWLLLGSGCLQRCQAQPSPQLSIAIPPFHLCKRLHIGSFHLTREPLLSLENELSHLGTLTRSFQNVNGFYFTFQGRAELPLPLPKQSKSRTEKTVWKEEGRVCCSEHPSKSRGWCQIPSCV